MNRNTFAFLFLWQAPVMLVGTVPGDVNSTSKEAISTHDQVVAAISAIEAAVLEANDDERLSVFQRQLQSYGAEALPQIKQALTNSNPRVRERLMEVFVGMRDDKATDVLLTLALNDPDNDVSVIAAGMLEKRALPRALSQSERETVISRLKSVSFWDSSRWAMLLAKARDATPSDATMRVSAIVEKYVADVMSLATNKITQRMSDIGMSSKAVQLSRMLMVFPHTDRVVSAPILKAREEGTPDAELKRWLLIARGFSRDDSAAEQLRGLVTDTKQDVSERALALRAYAIAAGTNAIPLLEQFVTSREVGPVPVPGIPPPGSVTRGPDFPLSVIAQGDLFWLKYPELRKRSLGW